MKHNIGTYRRVWAFAWPAIISNISVPLLGLVDSGVLGHLSSGIYLGGVAVGSALFTLIFWAFGFLRMGTTGLVAQALGNHDYQLSRKWLTQSIALAVAIGLLLIVVSPLLIAFALPLFGASADVLTQSVIYFHIRIFSAPAGLMNFVLIGWLIGMHQPRGPLVILLVANGLNIVLDLVFVIGLGMKTEGAALATVIADYVSLAAGCVMVVRTLKGKAGYFDFLAFLDVKSLCKLLLLNRHLFVRTLCPLGIQAFFMSQGAQSGDYVLAANALLLNMVLLMSYGLDGFAHAAEALTGKAIGQKRIDRFQEAVRASGYCSVVLAILFSVVFSLLGGHLIDLLTDISEVSRIADNYLPWLAVMPLLSVWCFWLDGVFIGAVRTDMMQHTMLVATLVVFFPVWYLTRDLGNHGLWMAYSAFMLARSAGLALAYRSISLNNGWLAGKQG